jgi:hypothetical protein
VGEDDATRSLGPEQSSDSGTPLPAPPARGWYRNPDNPNYEHFWDGQKWTSQRYWGGASPRESNAPSDPPPPLFPSPFPPPVAGTQVVNGPPSPEVPTTWNAGPPAGQATEARFYAVTTLIVPPVFIAFLALIAQAEIPHRATRVVGIGAVVFIVAFIVFLLRRPYAAIVRRNGSLTFKSLTGSQETTLSRVSRIGVIMGNRGGSWVFYFDGTRAVLGDIGGLRLKRYLIAYNPALG